VEQISADDRLTALADADLVALRLGAQVLAHKAELAERSLVAAYFELLERSVLAELASRTRGIRAMTERPAITLPALADAEDRRLTAEYLGLLVANERLSPQLRDLCRALRAGDGKSRDGRSRGGK
jgi:hypothetical protein